MNKTTAVMGYAMGVLVGFWLVILVAPMGALGHGVDPLLYSCHMSPFGMMGSVFGFVLQVFCFWGVLGALAAQGRLLWARLAFIALLVLHYVVVAASVAGGHSYEVGSAGLQSYLFYIAFLGVLVIILATTWLQHPDAQTVVRTFIETFPWVMKVPGIILSLLVVALVGVMAHHLYRDATSPSLVQMLDLETGQVKNVRAARNTYICGIDEANKLFKTFKQSPDGLDMRTISFKGKLLDKKVTNDHHLSNGYLSPTNYSVETGRFAYCISNKIVVFAPGNRALRMQMNQGDIINLFWLSQASLLAVTTPDIAKRSAEDGNHLAPVPYYDAAIHIIDIRTQKSRTALKGITCGATSLSPDSRHLAFVNKHEDRTVLELLDLSSGQRRELTTTETGACIVQLQWSPDGKRLAWGYVAAPSAAEKEQSYLEPLLIVQWLDLQSSAIHTVPESTVGRQNARWAKFKFCGPNKLAFLKTELYVLDLQTLNGASYTVPSDPVEFFPFDGGKKILLAR